MNRILVTHVIEAKRPFDWASVLALKAEVDAGLAKAKYQHWIEPRYSRLMARNPHETPQHATRDVFDWQSHKVAVLIEGWVEKE